VFLYGGKGRCQQAKELHRNPTPEYIVPKIALSPSVNYTEKERLQDLIYLWHLENLPFGASNGHLVACTRNEFSIAISISSTISWRSACRTLGTTSSVGSAP